MAARRQRLDVDGKSERVSRFDRDKDGKDTRYI